MLMSCKTIWSLLNSKDQILETPASFQNHFDISYRLGITKQAGGYAGGEESWPETLDKPCKSHNKFECMFAK